VGNNIRLEWDYNTSDPTTLFNLTISEVDTTGAVVQSEVFRNLNLKSGDPANVIDVVNNGSRMVYLGGAASSGRPVATGTMSGPRPLPLPASVADGAQFTITLMWTATRRTTPRH